MVTSTDRTRSTEPMVIDIPGAFDSGWLEGSAFGQAVAGQMSWDDPQLDDDDRALGAAWAQARYIGGSRGSYRLRLTTDDVEAVWALMQMASNAEEVLADPEERAVKRSAATVVERCVQALGPHYMEQFPVGSAVTHEDTPMTVAGIVVQSARFKAVVALYAPGLSNRLVDTDDPALVKTSKEAL